VTPLHRITTGFLHDQGSWIFLPQEVAYEVSLDGRPGEPPGRRPAT
jgi:hypothetical protein